MALHPSLQHLAHRPWPLPTRPWEWRQTWHDLLFLHWPVPAAALRRMIPAALDLDKFAGNAWVTVTPFWMSGIGRRNWPALPFASRFEELNVRSYVRFHDRPGVWFFSLDAASLLAVIAARRLYGLPYFHASMWQREDAGRIAYRSRRRSGTRFEASYWPTGPATESVPGTLEHWLTERYCLYAQGPSGNLYRAEIHHAPWRLQAATATILRNDLFRDHAIELEAAPAQCQFSRRIDVVVWSRERVDVDGDG